MNKFKIKISKVKYGWITIRFYSNNTLITTVNGSGVYNPFYEIDNLFSSIRGRKDFNWEIDQEGRIADIKIKNLGKIVKITFENYYKDIGKTSKTVVFNKKQFLTELKNELNKFNIKERGNLRKNHYYFDFRLIS